MTTFASNDARPITGVYRPRAHSHSVENNSAPASISDAVFPDSFFDLTPSDLARLSTPYGASSSSLSGKKHASSRNVGFTLKSQRDAERNRIIDSCAPIRVRILLPKQHVVETTINARETIGDLRSFVDQRILQSQHTPSELWTTPPRTTYTPKKDDARIMFEFAPRVIMRVKPKNYADDDVACLQPSVQELLQDFPTTTGKKDEDEDEETREKRRKLAQEEEAAAAAAAAAAAKGKQPASKGVPKWFKR